MALLNPYLALRGDAPRLKNLNSGVCRPQRGHAATSRVLSANEDAAGSRVSQMQSRLAIALNVLSRARQQAAGMVI
jgi:hypothetical protein